VKFFRASAIWRSRFWVAALAGLLLGLAFPKVGLAGFAWIAPGLMVAAALGTRGWETFRIGYVAGLVHYLVSLSWLLHIPFRWHGAPLGPALGLAALSAYLALFPAAWVWFVTQMAGPRRRDAAPEAGGAGFAVAHQPLGQMADWLPDSWAGRAQWALAGAVAWVAVEMVIARLFSGFPWNLLGASQYLMLPLIQVASVTGVYGVSFLVVWVSLALLCAALMVLGRPGFRTVWMGEIFIPVICVAVVFNVGFRQTRQPEPADRFLKLAMVQPSIPQTLIWDNKEDDRRFAELVRLSEQALSNRVDLLVWPEAAIPRLIKYDRAIFQAVTNLAISHHVWMIIGADDAEARPNSRNPDDEDYFNSSFLISPEGRVVAEYRKRNLVIFGEYLPLGRTFPFLKSLIPIGDGFVPGKRAVPFVLEDLKVRSSVLICFEDTFAWLGREAADAGGDLIVNLTNNGWFEESAAQWQHAASAFFRAVETGVPLVRCSNNGLTCWVDAHGRMRELFRDVQGSVYGPGFLICDLPLPAPGEAPTPTFYRRHGDVFGWGCVAIMTLMALRHWGRPRKT
jgi:apolipoprotein N-acyltransferase